MNRPSNYDKAHADAERIFRTLLPTHGLVIRQAQIDLCHEMLDALFLNRVTLCDAGVGIGKTYAYLIAGVLWQVYRPVGFPRTVTISTSSIALQNAILKEYLPLLSRIFAADGILSKPIHAVIRKGRERFACDLGLSKRLRQIDASERIGAERKAALNQLKRNIDLDEISHLSNYDRAIVQVPEVCPQHCAQRNLCRYQEYIRQSKGMNVSIQICNHNYLLADAMHRQQGLYPLLKDYHILIVDEAHKLPEAARQMYGKTLSLHEITELSSQLRSAHLPQMSRMVQQAGNALAASLQAEVEPEGKEEPFTLNGRTAGAIRRLQDCLKKLSSHADKLPHWMLRQVSEMSYFLSDFQKGNADKVLYIQYAPTGIPTLCAVSRKLPEQIERSVWRRGSPAILTSGTLAAGGSFARTRQVLGLEKNIRCREFTASSPFDYAHNSLLYLPGDAGKYDSSGEIHFLTERIRQLTLTTYGHALVLFTSYSLMSDVCKKLRDSLPFPLIEAWRGNQQAVRQFKQLPNAVLCAAGPCWEGIDFPGDMVSLLIIPRLPFPVPNPVSDAERERYPNLQSYIRAVVIPEMQTKLRQGVGRAIRTETDTCVIAILDKRAAPGGRYHAEVKNALPPCPITSSLKETKQFIRARKGPEYFLA